MQEQSTQGNREKIEKFNYCRGHKEWNKKVRCEKYLLDRKPDGKTKEQWARLRCGNLGREKSKEFRDDNCTLC